MMNLEDITWSATSQSQKYKYSMIPFVWGSFSIQNHGEKAERWFRGAREGGSKELLINEYRFSVL